jgi:hypothetical protein
VDSVPFGFRIFLKEITNKIIFFFNNQIVQDLFSVQDFLKRIYGSTS